MPYGFFQIRKLLYSEIKKSNFLSERENQRGSFVAFVAPPSSSGGLTSFPHALAGNYLQLDSNAPNHQNSIGVLQKFGWVSFVILRPKTPRSAHR